MATCWCMSQCAPCQHVRKAAAEVHVSLTCPSHMPPIHNLRRFDGLYSTHLLCDASFAVLLFGETTISQRSHAMLNDRGLAHGPTPAPLHCKHAATPAPLHSKHAATPAPLHCKHAATPCEHVVSIQSHALSFATASASAMVLDRGGNASKVQRGARADRWRCIISAACDKTRHGSGCGASAAVSLICLICSRAGIVSTQRANQSNCCMSMQHCCCMSMKHCMTWPQHPHACAWTAAHYKVCRASVAREVLGLRLGLQPDTHTLGCA
eukprot:CAMPEP_0196667326 /NCGR_PEP_ID=MMETSP1086-20130531/65022_1 /TAXON_ID=77921 /ORGANISM="Cyanoptyche  gloeocystis , Strain SAG4.97" /LENGTH=266 /DNA_ID=CAMNT_0042004647 /DNA_START=389 /DNA_END=1190 /DNA_ORIENTATION=+